MEQKLSRNDLMAKLLNTNQNVTKPVKEPNKKTASCTFSSKGGTCPVCGKYHRCIDCVETCDCGHILV